MRLSLSDNLPQDDVTSNILAQTLAPGYVLKQPPLYEWLLWSVQRLIGPTLPSFLILKYGLLTATFGFLYLLAKRVFADQRWAALAALSPLLLYHIGWNLHEGVTQTMALICAVAASTWAFMRLAERGRGCRLSAARSGRRPRASEQIQLCWLPRRVARERCGCSRRCGRASSTGACCSALAPPRLVTAPFVYWLIEGSHDLVAFYGTAMAPMADTNRLEATAIGLGKSIYAPLAFCFRST